MTIFLVTFLVIGVAALGMAVGVIAGRRPIAAGCGRSDETDGPRVGCEACRGGAQTGPGGKASDCPKA